MRDLKAPLMDWRVRVSWLDVVGLMAFAGILLRDDNTPPMDVHRRILLCHCVGGDLAQVEGAARSILSLWFFWMGCQGDRR